MALSGYSGTPLAKKLGIREGSRLGLVNQPDNYFSLFTDLPSTLQIVRDPKKKKDIIHYFVREQKQLVRDLLKLKAQIEENGMIWVSWPKKSSGEKTDITEDVIRVLAIKCGLVDIKVCAVDETWSGLKLVIPLKERGKKAVS